MSKFDPTTYTDVLINTTDGTTLDATVLRKWYEDIKRVADLIDATLTTHLDETALDDVHGLLSGGKIIEEVGENENGHYVKFADGTLLCYLDFAISLAVNASTDELIDIVKVGAGKVLKDGDYGSLRWDFPAAFINTSQIVFPSIGTRNAVNSTAMSTDYRPLATNQKTYFSFFLWNRGGGYSSSAANGIRGGLFAIGRWKE